MGDWEAQHQPNPWMIPAGGVPQAPPARQRRPGAAAVRWAVVFAVLAVVGGLGVVGLSFLWILAAMAPPGMAEWLFPRARHVATWVVLPPCLLSVAAAWWGIRRIRDRDPRDLWRRQDRGLAVFALVLCSICIVLVGTSYL